MAALDPAQVSPELARPHRERNALARTAERPLARIGLVLLSCYAILAVVSLIWRPDGSAITGSILESPSSAHPFGTDDFGRDVLTRVVAGGGALIGASLCAAVTAVVLGGLLGAFLAFRGGHVDFAAMRVIDALLSVPVILVALLASALLPAGYLSLYLIAGLVQVLPVTRVCRGIFRGIFQREFVSVAALRGDSALRLIVREALPNVLGPILVEFAVRWSASLLLITSLNFLGVGVQPPAADWGLMLYEGRNYLIVAPWLACIPAALIAGLAVSINFTADGVARAVGDESHVGGMRR